MPGKPQPMCPKYCGVALEPIKVGKVEVDRCPKCEGVWFDSKGDELLEVIRVGWDKAPEPIRRSWEAGGVKFAMGKPNKYNCPRCGRELNTYNYLGVRGAFAIDGCPGGHGVWLDDSELGKAHVALKRSAAEQQALAAPKSGIIASLFAVLAGR
ncbi:MAG: zf-TFIIB domain-containing protein [bacterium]